MYILNSYVGIVELVFHVMASIFFNQFIFREITPLAENSPPTADMAVICVPNSDCFESMTMQTRVEAMVYVKHGKRSNLI